MGGKRIHEFATVFIVYNSYFFSLKRSNIPCPTPIRLKKHVLMMSFIGDSNPAKKLKQVEWLNEENKFNAFLQVKDVIYYYNKF